MTEFDRNTLIKDLFEEDFFQKLESLLLEKDHNQYLEDF